MNRILIKLLFIFSFVVIGCATKKNTIAKVPPTIILTPKAVVENFLGDFDSEDQKKWVDSVCASMSFDEKLGQLFMVSAYSNKDSIIRLGSYPLYYFPVPSENEHVVGLY